MFDLATLKNNKDFFLSINQRIPQGVYFYRIIGFDSQTLKFLRQYQIATQKCGLYIKKTIPNPTENEVQYFYDQVGDDFSLNKSHIYNKVKLWLKNIQDNINQLLAESIYELLFKLQNQGMSQNILKNAYIKFMCWIRYVFEGVLSGLGEQNPPKVLYEGDISKYEVYMLAILSKAGCDVVLVNFASDDSYLKIDKESKFSNAVYLSQTGVPSIHFTKIDLNTLNKVEELEQSIKNIGSSIVTNLWLNGSFFDSVDKKNSTRGGMNGVKINNLFIKYLGIDKKEEYLNRLFRLKCKIQKSNKPFIIIDKKIMNPTMEEVSKINKVYYSDDRELIASLALSIHISSDKTVNMLARRAFVIVMEQEKHDNIAQLYNHGIRLLCWLKRYTENLYQLFSIETIPVTIYYGACSENEASFLTLLSMIPMDVIVICADKNSKDSFINLKAASDIKTEMLSNSMEMGEYPKTEIKVKAATTAYEAERDLDQIMYTGTGLFRNRQFLRSNPVTLKTTYDEIGILWKEEAKYRPSFEVDDSRVVVPNLFAKICGVEKGDINEYFKKIKGMITEHTILIKKIPYITDENENKLKPFVYKFIEGGKIIPERIKKHNNYSYDFLSDNTQDYILEKIQTLINLKWIEYETMGLENVILSTLLNLDKQTVRLIQQFDFTKEIPKVIAIDVDESMFSLEDCIYFSFLNLVGFDIAIFTPTGYRNIEKYIKKEAFEEHIIGELTFNLIVPNLRGYTQSENSATGIFNKLFGIGRK